IACIYDIVKEKMERFYVSIVSMERAFDVNVDFLPNLALKATLVVPANKVFRVGLDLLDLLDRLDSWAHQDFMDLKDAMVR
ncbi:Hypothetical protein FKW44_008431, partial [Caligus rogercresseyi]